MQKITALWQCVKACVKACMNWVWQNRLSAFLVMVGVALFAILFGVMFNECVEYWVKRALGIGRKRDAIQFISWSIIGTFVFWILVMGGRWGVPKIKNNMEKMKVIGWWIRKNPVDAFLLLIGLILVTVLFLVMFSDYVGCWAKDILGAKDKKDAIQSVGLGFAGVLAVFGAIAVNRRANAQIKDNELVEKGHVQERFKAAVEHLGSDNVSARIASFYEFSYLARDNDDLRKNILDILCAHLRQTTTDKKYQEKIEFNITQEDIEGEKVSRDSVSIIEPADKRKVDKVDLKKVRPTEEVQSLLDVLFQKDSQNKFVFAEFKSNLRKVFLVRADLRKANLQGADMQRTNLQWGYFRRANLQDAILWRANLYKADLQNANLQKAVLWYADLRGANLRKADLQGANLWDADLRGADLRDVKNLETAKLRGAKVKSNMFPDGRELPKGVIIVDEDDAS